MVTASGPTFSLPGYRGWTSRALLLRRPFADVRHADRWRVAAVSIHLGITRLPQRDGVERLVAGCSKSGRHLRNFLTGQYSNALRVVAFNTAEGWSRDVSEDLAGALLERAFDDDVNLTEHTKRFIKRHMNLGAHSTVKCNGQIFGVEENLARGFVAENLSGARVEFILDPLDIGIGQNSEV
jgi:hypothetical protein